jgi:nitrous oxidase accessory protein
VERGRYGSHFMYSHDNVIEGNDYLGDVVGVFVMYSRGLRLIGNRMRDAHGAAGMGIGLKDSGNVLIANNELSNATTALYLDSSPLNPADRVLTTGNRIVLSDRAIVFHGSSRGNRVDRNVLAGNGAQVVVEGGGDARDALFTDNYYDDYAGYDLDGDGWGDVPHEERSLAADVARDRPDLAFFAGSPALGIVEAIGKLVPLFAPKTLMRDERPRSTPARGESDAS